MSLVLDLQKELYDNKISAEEALRKAYVISRRLNINDMNEWINNELNGYQNVKNIPTYRNINGTVEAFNPYHGWYPIKFTDLDIEEILNNINLNFSISEMESMIKNSKTDIIYLKTGATSYLVGELNTKVRFQTSTHTFIGITNRVKNIILDWTLQLEEKGILGENFSFTNEEKEKGKEVLSPIINILFGDNNVVNSSDVNQDINKE